MLLESTTRMTHPLEFTDADPRLISPADILHMREGDEQRHCCRRQRNGESFKDLADASRRA